MLEELAEYIKEATSDVEKELSLEDKGWIKLGQGDALDLTGQTRQIIVKRSRRYYQMDPLARQAIRLWCDYTFGSGISYQSDDEKIQEILDNFWENPTNRKLLSAQGQRKSSDKLLVDGEVFFALFLGSNGQITIRYIDPLEIQEIITDSEDIENVKFYKREWIDTQLKSHTSIYRSIQNIKKESAKDSAGNEVTSNEEALVYHLAFNTIGQRGNPLLLPVLDWIDEYRRFLAARIAIVRALARFAWKGKVMGGSTAVAVAKAKTEGKYPQAGSTWIENMGLDLSPIKTDTGASNAYQDGRMIKLQIAAGLGIPEQYFSDISTGNLATAKTVELPMLKMFSSYQQVWADAYRDIFNVMFEHNGIAEDKQFVDIDFPEIAPSDAQSAIKAILDLVTAFPEFANSRDVQQQALLNIGINNVSEVLDNLAKTAKENADIKLVKALREFKESLIK